MPIMEKETVIQGPGNGTDWERLRFAACVSIYGAAIGAAAILVNLLSHTEALEIPQHLPLGRSLLLGITGALAGVAITLPVAYWIYGGVRVFARKKEREARGIRTWVVLGIGFGFVYSLVMGAYFLSTSADLMRFSDGELTLSELGIRYLDVTAGRWVVLAHVLGMRLLFTGFVAGLLFGPGAWAINRFSTSADPSTARYGSWVIALALAGMVITVAAFAPETTLARFG